jgi:uncharacterized protein (TIRG00374 family)
LVITIGIILFLLTQISLHDLLSLLKTTDPLWAFAGMIGYILAIFFRALRFKWLIHSQDISLLDLMRISVLHNVSLMILPSKMGELSYPYLLNKISGMNITEGLASLIASRVYDFIIVLILFLYASFGFQPFFKINPFFVIFLAALLIVFTLFLFFYMSSILRGLSKGLGKGTERLGIENSKAFRWVQTKMHEVAEDFYAIQARKTYLPVTLTSLLSWITAFWMFYAFLRGFGTPLSFLKVIFASTIALLANMLPISAIGNWGILEAGWAAGFLLVGLSKEKAISSGFGVHILIFITGIVLGFVCWITLRPSHRLKEEEQKPETKKPFPPT